MNLKQGFNSSTTDLNGSMIQAFDIVDCDKCGKDLMVNPIWVNSTIGMIERNDVTDEAECNEYGECVCKNCK
jgi:hypothetical protein